MKAYRLRSGSDLREIDTTRGTHCPGAAREIIPSFVVGGKDN
jgi:hypothetical protein